MQHNSFFTGCNYSNRDITDARPGWSLCPVQDIDTVFTNRYNVNVNVDDTLSLLYCDLYVRELKETLKHTMLVHESVFESQIHELHRLYRKQKELMMEMKGTRHHAALCLNPGFPIPRTHWMSSSISTYQTMNFPHGKGMYNHIEAGLLLDNKTEKSGKKVVNLELPVLEFNNKNGEVHEASNFLKEQSLKRMYLESVKQSNKMQLDLNEPAKVEEHSDYVLNEFLSSVTSNEIGEESGTKNEGEDSVKGSHGMNEAQGSVNCRGGYGIDLNISPLSSEEKVNSVKKFETDKPQVSLSVSLHEKHGSKHSLGVIQALPCSTSILLLNKRYKTSMRGSRSRKKVKLGPSNRTGSDLYLHLNAQAPSESQNNQVSKEKGSLRSLSKVECARNWTKRRCKPQMKSSKGRKLIVKNTGKIKRKKCRRISLVTEGSYQEISAAETIVDMSRKSSGETTDCITSLGRNLLWFAEISSSVAEDYEMDYSETKTLQLTEMKLVEHKKKLKLNSSDNKTAVSSIVLGREGRSQAMQGKQKCNGGVHEHGDNPSLCTCSECGADEDLQVTGTLIEASESKCDCRFPKNKRKSSTPKSIDAFSSSLEEKSGVYWGAIRKRKRGSRIPATDFQHMIIKQVVKPN